MTFLFKYLEILAFLISRISSSLADEKKSATAKKFSNLFLGIGFSSISKKSFFRDHTIK